MEFPENQIIMGTDREYYSVCYPVRLNFLNCLDDEQWSCLRSRMRNPNTRARFAKQSKTIVDVAVQTVLETVLPALMVIVDHDDTERAGMESESSPPSNSLKDRIALEIDMEASAKHLDPLTGEVMVAIADGMASVEEKNRGNGQKTGNVLRELAGMMSCCRPKSRRFQTGSPRSVTGATPPPCTQGSGITLGSVQAGNAEILSDPMFHLAAAKAASEVLRRSSPSPSLSLAPIAAVSCPEMNTWSPMSDRLPASQAQSVASAIVDGFVKDVTEVTERFQSEGAAVEREPLFSRVSRDAKRLYLSLQTRVRVSFAPVACCAKTPVTPDLLRGELDVEIPSAPELLQADITSVKMDEEELVDKEIDNCANEVLGSLMEACMVVGVVFNRDHRAGVSVGLSPTNDLTHYTSTLMSALQGTSPTFDLTSSGPEDEKRQSIRSAETTMEQDIPTIRKLSTPTFQHYATQNVGEVLLRAKRSFTARRMPHLTPQTSHSNVNQTPTPSLHDKVDFETEALRLVEVFVSEVAAFAKEVAMGMESENTAKVCSQDDRVAEDFSRATEEASVHSTTTTNERIASASRNIFSDLRMRLAEFFNRGSMTTEEFGLTPKEGIAVGAESPAPWAESRNVEEKADMVVSEILSSMKAGLAEKAPSVSSGISEDAVSLEARIFVGEILDTLENFTGTSGTASPLEKGLAEVQEVPQTSPVPSHKMSTMATIQSPHFRAKATKSVSAAVLQSFVDLYTLVGPSLSLPQMTVTGLNAACLPRVAEEVVELFVITIEDERRTTDQSLRSAQCMPSALRFVEQLQERLRGFYARVLTAIKVKDQSESCPEFLTLSVSDHFLDAATNNVVQNILSTVQELDNSEGEVAPTRVPPLVRSESSLDASVRIRDIVACLDNITAVGSSTSLKTLLVSPEAVTEALVSEAFQNTATQRLQELLQKCLCTSRGVKAGAIESKPATGSLEKAAGELLDTVVGCVKRMLQGSRRSGKSSESATQRGGSVVEISEEEMWCTTRHISKKLQEKTKACLAVNKAAEVSLTGNTLTRAKESLGQILVAVRDQTEEENIHLKALAGAMLKNIDKLPEVEDEGDGDKEDAESLTLFDARSDSTREDYSKASMEGQMSQRSSESELTTTPATLKAYPSGSSTDLGSSQARHQGPSAGSSCSSSQLMADVVRDIQAKPHGSSPDRYSAKAALARLEELVAQGSLQRTTEELVGKLQTLLKSEGSVPRSVPAGNSTSDSVLSGGHARRTGQPLKEVSLELIYSFAEEAVKRLLSSVLLPPPSWGFDKEDSLSSSQSGSSSSSRASPSSSYDRSYDDTVSLYTKVLVCQVMSAVEDPSSHSGLDLWKRNVVPTASTSSSKIRLDVRKSREVPVGSAPSSETQLDAREAVVVPSFSALSSETGLDASWDTGLTDCSFHTPSRETLTSEDLLADSSANRKDKATSIGSNDWPAAPTVCPVCHRALVQKKGLAKLRERYNNWKHEHAEKKKEKSARKVEGTTDAAPFSRDPSMAQQDPAEIVARSALCWCVPSTQKVKQNKPHKGLLQAFRDTRFCRAIVGCMTEKAH